MMSIKRVFCIFVIAVVGCKKTAATITTKNTNLKYFSVWELEGAESPAVAKGWSNFLFTSGNISDILRWHAAGVGPSLLHVRDVFFDGDMLRADWEQRWESTFAQLSPAIANGAAMGVFLGDELAWSCIPLSNISAVASRVRVDIPRGKGIIYYNEAFPPFVPDGMKMWQTQCPKTPAAQLSYSQAPEALDWLSIDYYPDEGTVEGAIKLVQGYVYPKMSSDQYFLFVPPAYGAGNDTLREQLCCNQNTRDGPNPECNANCTSAMIQWAVACYNWARNDTRIVGLNPWHWTGAAVANARFEPGLSNLPTVLDMYKKIGQEIVQGTLGDVE
eukprot:m.269978 g.269978  ORF g.269978 m.269978 type:complete len:330 (+) comp16260_c0_seq2:38-1027(+)